jgi:hypothetical protein
VLSGTEQLVGGQLVIVMTCCSRTEFSLRRDAILALSYGHFVEEPSRAGAGIRIACIRRVRASSQVSVVSKLELVSGESNRMKQSMKSSALAGINLRF